MKPKTSTITTEVYGRIKILTLSFAEICDLRKALGNFESFNGRSVAEFVLSKAAIRSVQEAVAHRFAPITVTEAKNLSDYEITKFSTAFIRRNPWIFQGIIQKINYQNHDLKEVEHFNHDENAFKLKKESSAEYLKRLLVLYYQSFDEIVVLIFGPFSNAVKPIIQFELDQRSDFFKLLDDAFPPNNEREITGEDIEKLMLITEQAKRYEYTAEKASNDIKEQTPIFNSLANALAKRDLQDFLLFLSALSPLVIVIQEHALDGKSRTSNAEINRLVRERIIDKFLSEDLMDEEQLSQATFHQHAERLVARSYKQDEMHVRNEVWYDRKEADEIRKVVGDVIFDPDGWLIMPNDQLGGRQPIDLLRSGNNADYKRVRDLLEAIRHGAFT